MTDDPIARARQLVADIAHEQRRDFAENRFRSYKPRQLVQLYDTGCDLDGRKLTDVDVLALANAWADTFREQMPAASIAPCGPLDRPVPHAFAMLPDTAMIRPRQARDMLGIGRSTLKRWIADGIFPKPQQLIPGCRPVGWPARQLKAWLQLRETGEVDGHG